MICAANINAECRSSVFVLTMLYPVYT